MAPKQPRGHSCPTNGTSEAPCAFGTFVAPGWLRVTLLRTGVWLGSWGALGACAFLQLLGEGSLPPQTMLTMGSRWPPWPRGHKARLCSGLQGRPVPGHSGEPLTCSRRQDRWTCEPQGGQGARHLCRAWANVCDLQLCVCCFQTWLWSPQVGKYFPPQ